MKSEYEQKKLFELIKKGCFSEKDCFEWQGAYDKNGYGVTTFSPERKKIGKDGLIFKKEKIMESTQVLAIIGSNLIIMLTFFCVSMSLLIGIREEVRSIQTEMRDFHGRLCAIEERVKK